MLNMVYTRLDDPDVLVTLVSCHLPIFGRWCKLHVSSYSVGGGTAITFGLQPSDTLEVSRDRGNATFGKITLARGNAGNRQLFEQGIEAPKLTGQLLDWSTLADGGTPAGRTVSAAIRNRSESIVETVRQHIRRNVGKNVKEQTIETLNERFGKTTYETIRSFLGEINWRLMLEGAGLDEDGAALIDYESANIPIRVFRITHDDDTDIPLIANAELNRFDCTTLANIKATTLLKKVCGEELGEQFEKTGKIIVYKHDYRFEIAPGQFVSVTDPNGKTARLCIHTVGFSCNPIDEVIISYLHIRNKFDEWMAIAAAHSPQAGFQQRRKQELIC